MRKTRDGTVPYGALVEETFFFYFIMDFFKNEPNKSIKLLWENSSEFESLEELQGFCKKLEKENILVLEEFRSLSEKYYWSVKNMPIPRSKDISEQKRQKDSLRMMQFLLMEAIMQSVGKLGGEEHSNAMRYFWKYATSEDKQILIDALDISIEEPPFKKTPQKYKDDRKKNIDTEYWGLVLNVLYEWRNTEHHATGKRIFCLFVEGTFVKGMGIAFTFKTPIKDSIEGRKCRYSVLSSLAFSDFRDIFEKNFLRHFQNFITQE